MYMQPTSLCQLPDSIILGFWYPLSLLYSLLDQAGQNFTDTILSRTCVSPMNFLDGMGLTFLDKIPQGLFWINPFTWDSCCVGLGTTQFTFLEALWYGQEGLQGEHP